MITIREDKLDDEIGLLHQYGVQGTFPLLHDHEFREIFVVLAGQALHLVNDKIQSLSKGDIVFTRPWDQHKYDFYKSNDFEIIVYGFSNRIYRACQAFLENDLSHLEEGALPPIIRMDDIDLHRIRKTYHVLEGLSNQDRKVKFKLHIGELMYKFFLHYETDAPYLLQENIPESIMNAIKQMKQPDNMRAGLTKMVEISNYSQEHLTRQCKKCIGLTPTEIINDFRLNYAAEMLLETDMDILHIYEEVGFNNLSHFYHLFKKKYGMSPLKYRKTSGGLTAPKRL